MKVIAAIVALAAISAVHANPTWPDAWSGAMNINAHTDSGDYTQVMVGTIQTEGSSAHTSVEMNIGGGHYHVEEYCTTGQDVASAYTAAGGQKGCQASCIAGRVCPGNPDTDCTCQVGEMDTQINMLLSTATFGGTCVNSYGDSGGSYAVAISGVPMFTVCISSDNKPVYFHVESQSGNGRPGASSTMISFHNVQVGPQDSSDFTPPADCKCLGRQLAELPAEAQEAVAIGMSAFRL